MIQTMRLNEPSMSTIQDHIDDRKVFVKVLGVKNEDVLNWVPKPAPQWSLRDETLSCQTNGFTGRTKKPTVSSREHVGARKDKGYLVEVNDELIAIFRVQDKLYAIKDSCPHAGGPLSLGDIEELPYGEGLCVTCPWHQYKILLRDGTVGERKGRKQTTDVYPIFTTESGDIYIGFDKLARTFFDVDKHHSSDVLDFGKTRVLPGVLS